jgi:hypothetical protein
MEISSSANVLEAKHYIKLKTIVSHFSEACGSDNDLVFVRNLLFLIIVIVWCLERKPLEKTLGHWCQIN